VIVTKLAGPPPNVANNFSPASVILRTGVPRATEIVSESPIAIVTILTFTAILSLKSLRLSYAQSRAGLLELSNPHDEIAAYTQPIVWCIMTPKRQVVG